MSRATSDPSPPPAPDPTGSDAWREDLRVKVPLWVKLGVLFGGLFATTIAVNGAFELSGQQSRDAVRQRSQLEAFAQAVALGIDGDAHATFASESDRDHPDFVAAREQLRVVMEATEDVDWGATSARDAAGRWSYVIDASRTAPFPIGYPIFDGVPWRDRALLGEPQYVEALEDEFGRWHTAYVPIRDRAGEVVGLVELVNDADRDGLVLRGELRRALMQVGAAIAVTLLVSFLFGRLLSRHLAALVRAARLVAKGRLEDVRVDIATRDEIGVLGTAFNQMVDGLREREFIRDTFGRFVNPDVVESILADRSRLELGGEKRTVTVLMSDLRGFTAMSEELGAQAMVGLLNRYLSRMTEIVSAHNGNVSELLGDGMVILFGAPVARGDDAARAVRCAVAMQCELQRFRVEEGRDLQMGIGVDTGVVVAGNIGSEQHMKYGVVGPPINMAARLEGFTLGGQVLISDATLADAGDDVRTEPSIEFRAKGRRLPVRCHPVLAAGGLTVPEADEFAQLDVRIHGRVWRVEGKAVAADSERVLVVRLDPQQLVVELPFEPDDRQAMKLELQIEGQRLGDLYGTVAGPHAEHEGGTLIRLTSVPADVRRTLDAWLQEHTDDARL